MLDPKWTGTDTDRREMRTLNIQQVVRRNFGKLAIFGFSSTLLCTWETIAVTLSISLSNGGTAGLFWNYIACAIGISLVYASIAELGSMIPTAGGQYFWVAVLAPRWCRHYLSYITGWLCATTWQGGLAGCAYLSGTIVQALIALNTPDYVPQRWQGSLLFIAFLFIAVLFNTILARRLPLVEGIFVFIHIIGIVIFIPLLILSPRRAGGGPLVEFYNPNGWMSNGVATFAGVVPVIGALTGFDCSVHMAEEVKDASITVPFALLAGNTLNVLLGFFVVMTCIYTVGPLDKALTSVSGYPIIDMFYKATQSYAATDVMTTILIICFCAATIATLASASRQLWSFARNGGVPYSSVFAPKNLPYDIPLQSVFCSLIISLILALINIGSTEVLNTILSLTSSGILSTYIITIFCILLHRLRGRKLPRARYMLGKWGVWVNIGALIYTMAVFPFTFWPPAPKPTLDIMNWSSLMYGAVIILATVYYVIHGRKTYTLPKETIEELSGFDDDIGKEEASAGHVEKIMEESGKFDT